MLLGDNSVEAFGPLSSIQPAIVVGRDVFSTNCFSHALNQGMETS
jgi:hypothetical protein